MKTGQVQVTGPFTKEEKVKWDWLRERKVDFDQSIAENEKLLRDDPDYELRNLVLKGIEYDKKIWNMIDKVITD